MSNVINAVHRFQQRRIDRYLETARKMIEKHTDAAKFCPVIGQSIPKGRTCAECRCCDKGA